MNNHS